MLSLPGPEFKSLVGVRSASPSACPPKKKNHTHTQTYESELFIVDSEEGSLKGFQHGFISIIKCILG